MAAQAVKRGRIRVNGERAKPSREVKAGNCLSIVRGSQTIDVTVLGMPARRGPAADNTRFFEESPESIGRREQARLRTEHSTILGMLDRIIRSTDALGDQTVEDKDVFFLRVRELLATVRRHEAEEDRLFYLAVWRETGGES